MISLTHFIVIRIQKSHRKICEDIMTTNGVPLFMTKGINIVKCVRLVPGGWGKGGGGGLSHICSVQVCVPR